MQVVSHSLIVVEQVVEMKSPNTTNGKLYEKYTWTIDNFSKLDSEKIYKSETFFLRGYPWRIIIFPKRNEYLSVYLDAGDLASLPKEWSRYASFKLALVNQVNASRTIVKETIHKFNASLPSWGFTNFIHWDKLCDSRNGFIVNDTCKVAAGMVSIMKSELEGQDLEAILISENDVSPASAPTICVEPIKHTDNPLPKETSMASLGDLVDFRGLGKIEKTFVPLLEEVCSWHPSLVDNQRKRNRSRMFTEWAFTALGRVLHFLKTKKAKDMNEEACNHLQILWEELETFGFDLSWLEPHLQSALGMESYKERAAQVKRLKENVNALEKDLKIATSNLVEAEDGFIERDLDAELGYGRP